MLSQLGPLFRTMFRQAESADARMEIHREDKNTKRRKTDDAEDDADDNNLWEDSTDVSIPALQSFLSDFLRTHGAEMPAPETSTQNPTLSETPPATNETGGSAPPSTIAARAVKAYTALTHTSPAPPPVMTGAEIQPSAPALSAQEIRMIHKLLDDLSDLQKRGFETLRFRMIGTFIELLQAAVDSLKAPFKNS